MSITRTLSLAPTMRYSVHFSTRTLTVPDIVAALGRKAQITIESGAASLTTYATADECREMTKFWAAAAVDIEAGAAL